MIDKKLVEIYGYILYENLKDLLQEDNSGDKIFSIQDLRIILTRFSINNSLTTFKLLNIDNEEQLETVNSTIYKIIDEALNNLKEKLDEIYRRD